MKYKGVITKLIINSAGDGTHEAGRLQGKQYFQLR